MKPLSDHKPVRSYVLRQGRISSAQTRALESLHPRYGVPYRDALLDARAVFGRDAPLIVEIGSGMGETTALIAAGHPEIDYLAIEVHAPGVGSLLKRIDETGLENLRVIRHDALDVLARMIPDAGLAGIHLFFPDPWPKKRHHKRRLVQPAFAALAARKLASGGYLHAATDWRDYAMQMLEVLSAETLIENTAPGFAPRPAYRPLTKFERRGLTLGHEVFDLVFRRRS
ncbi:MAG: tRNA (guanosine(46)-N7)-methyltransferase TrmB [Betaproteobacteria bacterium]|nr:tRNA (guanosine(46)-N7)-methyltransferase TrmB [Betaproteobacteria bacterium]